MRPQFFPWLFDDENAWEKSFANPDYNYEMPIDRFMNIYQADRCVCESAKRYALPSFAAPIISTIPTPQAVMPVSAVAPAFVSAGSFAAAAPAKAVAMAAAVMQEVKKEQPKQEGILSQDEIDALLAGAN
jgi:hypothetical protein